MTPAARLQAAIEILDLVIQSARDDGPPADSIVTRYFKTRRYAGSKDRRAVRELVFRAIRRSAERPVSGRSAVLGLADDEPALGPRMARLSDDMLQFAEAPREVVILDQDGQPLRAGDHARRFFEAPWLHKHQGRYYFSYSTGDTHFICYAIGDNPYGPFTYQGQILGEVVGWTTHHSICAFADKWYLFYHDAILSGGATHLRSIKMTELRHDAQGRILRIDPYGS